ncbi:MAG TPA: c-type cytochrome [Planctomycetota bacterium]|nr:c-type cytochrome [Planctomycetota bacterium]
MPQDTHAARALRPARTRRLPLFASGATALGAFALLGLSEGCNFEPVRPEVHFDLAESTTALDDEGFPRIKPVVQDQIRGALEMLFGTPSNPGYMLLSDWFDEGFDPNWPTYEVGDQGSGEFGEADLEDFAAGNRVRMARQIAAIEDGRYGHVVPPDTAPDLAAKWGELLARTQPDQRGEDFQAEALALFETWYPTLRDSAEMYRQQCLHCHGAEGGGDGPTADFLQPRPRDDRKGVFKFTPLRNKAVPRRADLYHILDEGVAGTAMPSFRRFSRAELEGLVDYVRLLSMRGMVENALVTTYELDEFLGAEAITESYRDVFEKWQKSEETPADLVIAWDGAVPAPTPESIARGRELFLDAKTGNCTSCHGDAGRGDGLSAFTIDPVSGAKVEAYQDDWGRPISPRNLRQGVLRGGRRPIDIYRRIKAGINGTPMPALEGVVPDEDIWSIVHFVGTLTEGGLFYPELGAHAAAADGQH